MCVRTIQKESANHNQIYMGLLKKCMRGGLLFFLGGLVFPQFEVPPMRAGIIVGNYKPIDRQSVWRQSVPDCHIFKETETR